MSNDLNEPPTESFDPEDWKAFRTLAHQMVDDMLDHLQHLPEQPAWQPIPEDSLKRFNAPLPREPQGEASAYKEFRQHVLPYPNGNLHPRFFGWAQGNGTPMGMMADMLASGMNPHLAGFNQAPAKVEEQVIGWIAELLKMPGSSSGVLTSGGTVANLIGLTIARHHIPEFDLHKKGLQHPGAPRLTVYASSETHGWINRSAQLLGVGTEAIRFIPVNADYQIDIEKLKSTLVADRNAGMTPFCIVANAGTVQTGAVDDMNAISELCQEHNLWMHVDGALAALASLIDHPALEGMEKADSIAVDLHKWGYLPFECGCIITRDADAHTDTFRLQASYLSPTARGVIAGGLPFSDRGLELTRSFKALKVWLSLKAYGTNKLARLIKQNLNQAQMLAQWIDDSPDLERLAPVPMHIVCFRYRGSSDDDAPDLDELNNELLIQLQENGSFVLSSARIDGAFVLRAAIVNHRTKTDDLKWLVKEVVRLGSELTVNKSSKS